MYTDRSKSKHSLLSDPENVFVGSVTHVKFYYGVVLML